jgi:hypothetical protein
MTDTEQHALTAADRLAAAGVAFIDAVAELQPLAEELAAAEVDHRVALHQAGVMHCHRPPARELAADVLLAAVGAFRPHVKAVTQESARRSADALRSMPCAADLLSEQVTA